MYEERREGFSLRDIILQILFVALFVFILMLVFPTKNFVTDYTDNAIKDAVDEALSDYEFGGGINSQAFANQLFNQNVMMMKDGAKDYFTLSRLPEKTNDQVKLTLKQMLSEKIILPFVDSNGKSCDVEESYVLVTKTDTEYLMKVNLKCSDYEDYLLVHMGCYDYCSTTICESKTPSNPSKGSDTEPTPTIYEYEYKLVIDGKWGEFGEWSEWTTNIISKTDYNEVETKVEKEFDKYIQVVDGSTTISISATEKVDYSCPDSSYTLNGNKCIKKKDIEESVDATAKITYSCPDSTYTLNGQKCYKVENTSDTIPATANVEYSCPSGYAQNGNMCVKYSSNTVEIAANKTVVYTCPSGYTKEGTKCTKTIETVAEASKKTTYTCPSGYTVSGSKCVKTSTISANASTNYTDWVYSGQTTSNTALVNTNTTKYVLAGTKVNSSCTSPCTNKYTYTYDIYKRSTKTTYTCPSGYTVSGSKCVSTTTTSAKANVTYTCPSGYSKNGNTCYKTETKTVNASSSTQYSCYSGYSLTASNTCVRTTGSTDTVGVSMNTTYSCPSGYEVFGSLCIKNTNNTYTTEAIANTTYSCPDSSYTLSGNKCYKTRSDSETISAIEKKTYSCPDGYDMKDNVCEKIVTKYREEAVYKDVTYYRSRTKSYIEGNVDYKWSRSQNDISLIKQGYSLTGNSRIVQ